MMRPRHLRTLLDLSKTEFLQIIEKAQYLKKYPRQSVLNGDVLAMIFEKSSTRTRVSFEAGMAQLGGSTIFLSPTDTQLGRGEPIQDSARVISSMVDIVMIRTFKQADIELFAEYSAVPVINGLSDDFHPCQLLADIQTFVEHRGSIETKTVAWVGDGNNMCQSWLNAAMLLDFNLHIACPKNFDPDPELLEMAGSRVTLFRDPKQAVADAHLVATDVYASMGQEAEENLRLEEFANFQVNHDLMRRASKGALFMHCLPAHRGEEVSEQLLEDDSISVVWDEAENRLHAQKALMLFLLGKMHDN